MSDKEQQQLDRVRGPAKTSRWARASRGVRRTAGRVVGLVGDTAKAAWGDKADDLQRNLHDVGESIRGPLPVDKTPYLVQQDPRWLGFQERVAVVRELAGLVPEIMSPFGWAHLFERPVALAQQMCQLVAHVLEDKPAWRPTLSDCDGYLDGLTRSITNLKRAGARARQSDDATTSQALAELRSPASQALNDLAGALARLVRASDAYLADAVFPIGEGEPRED